MKAKDMSYGDALKRLEEIVSYLENGEPDLDKMSAMVQEAGELIKFCKAKLRKTAGDLDKALNTLDNEE